MNYYKENNTLKQSPMGLSTPKERWSLLQRKIWTMRIDGRSYDNSDSIERKEKRKEKGGRRKIEGKKKKKKEQNKRKKLHFQKKLKRNLSY